MASVAFLMIAVESNEQHNAVGTCMVHFGNFRPQAPTNRPLMSNFGKIKDKKRLMQLAKCSPSHNINQTLEVAEHFINQYAKVSTENQK